MCLRTLPVSRTERVVSTVAATGLTVGIALLVTTVPRPVSEGFVPAQAPARHRSSMAERVQYVAARPAMSRSAEPPPPRTEPRPPQIRDDVGTPARNLATAPYSEHLVSDSAADVPPTVPVPIDSLGRGPRTPAPGGAVRYNPRPPGSTHPDSALAGMRGYLATDLATVRGGTPPQSERDEQLRAEALNAIAARGAGMPTARAAAGGSSIPIPLPFGGPSRAQRERDRAIHAQTVEILARLQRRADSIVTARRQQLADSLAYAEDSLRIHLPPNSE